MEKLMSETISVAGKKYEISAELDANVRQMQYTATSDDDIRTAILTKKANNFDQQAMVNRNPFAITDNNKR